MVEGKRTSNSHTTVPKKAGKGFHYYLPLSCLICSILSVPSLLERGSSLWIGKNAQSWLPCCFSTASSTAISCWSFLRLFCIAFFCCKGYTVVPTLANSVLNSKINFFNKRLKIREHKIILNHFFTMCSKGDCGAFTVNKWCTHTMLKAKKPKTTAVILLFKLFQFRWVTRV